MGLEMKYKILKFSTGQTEKRIEDDIAEFVKRGYTFLNMNASQSYVFVVLVKEELLTDILNSASYSTTSSPNKTKTTTITNSGTPVGENLKLTKSSKEWITSWLDKYRDLEYQYQDTIEELEELKSKHQELREVHKSDKDLYYELEKKSSPLERNYQNILNHNKKLVESNNKLENENRNLRNEVNSLNDEVTTLNIEKNHISQNQDNNFDSFSPAGSFFSLAHNRDPYLICVLPLTLDVYSLVLLVPLLCPDTDTPDLYTYPAKMLSIL
jgi:septal ring factor EnvC (AmiA/AmiB activator)